MRKANEINDFDDEEDYSDDDDDGDVEHENDEHIQLSSPSTTHSTIINSITSTVTIPTITTTSTTMTSVLSRTNTQQTATMEMKTSNEKSFSSSSSRLLAKCLCFFYSFILLSRYIHRWIRFFYDRKKEMRKFKQMIGEKNSSNFLCYLTLQNTHTSNLWISYNKQLLFGFDRSSRYFQMS